MPLQRLVGEEWGTAPTYNQNNNNAFGNSYTCVATGVVKEMRFYSLEAGEVRGAVYDMDGSDPDSLIWGDDTGVSVTADQWNSVSTDDIAVTSSIDYYLSTYIDTQGAVGQAGSGGSPILIYKWFNYANPWPDPFGTYSSNTYWKCAVQLWGYVPPTISDVDTDEDITTDQTNVVCTCNNAETSQGTGKLEISDNATYGSGNVVTQTIDSWSDTSIQFDVVQGALSAGTCYVWITTDSGQRNATGFQITLSSNGTTDTPGTMSSTASLGNVTDVIDHVDTAGTISSTASLGNVDDAAGQVDTPTAVSSTASLGNVNDVIDEVGTPQTVSSTASLGNVVDITDQVDTAGTFSSTASLESVDDAVSHVDTPNAISSTASIGNVEDDTAGVDTPEVISSTSSLGNVTDVIDHVDTAGTMSATASLGTVDDEIAHVDTPTAVSSTASLGNVIDITDQLDTPQSLSSVGTLNNVSDDTGEDVTDTPVQLTSVSSMGDVEGWAGFAVFDFAETIEWYFMDILKYGDESFLMTLDYPIPGWQHVESISGVTVTLSDPNGGTSLLEAQDATLFSGTLAADVARNAREVSITSSSTPTKGRAYRLCDTSDPEYSEDVIVSSWTETDTDTYTLTLRSETEYTHSTDDDIIGLFCTYAIDLSDTDTFQKGRTVLAIWNPDTDDWAVSQDYQVAYEQAGAGTVWKALQVDYAGAWAHIENNGETWLSDFHNSCRQRFTQKFRRAGIDIKRMLMDRAVQSAYIDFMNYRIYASLGDNYEDKRKNAKSMWLDTFKDVTESMVTWQDTDHDQQKDDSEKQTHGFFVGMRNI